MAGAIPSTTKHEKLTAQQNQQDPSKFYNRFLYKAVIVVICLVILPLFPSQAPEFINQSLLSRNWELLHLLFVGIAISYGLFSRRNDETEKENNSKFDNAQSVVSRFLHVSSFFEDEAESSSESDENKVQTWSNQNYRNKPAFVVAPQHSNFNEQSATNERIGEKPLLLPVRSLKSRISDPSFVQSVNESSASSISLSRSTSRSVSKRFASNSNKARNEEMEGFGSPKVEDKLKENAVLPSPVPWRSRSGRMETKQEVDNPTQYASMEESEFSKMESRSIKSQTSRSSRSNSMSSSPKLTPSPSLSSPKELPTSPSFSSEPLAKNAEDLVRKKGFYKSYPPPPPPPPPMFQKSITMKPRPSSFNEGASFDKGLKRSFTSERKDLNWSGDKPMGRVDSGMEVNPRGNVENISMGKSVRPARAGQNLAADRREREIGDQGMEGRVEKIQLFEEDFMEEPIRKTAGYEHMSFRTDKLMGHGSVPIVSEPVSLKVMEEEKERFLDKVIVEYDEETESEDDEVGASFIQKDSDGPPSSGVSDDGPDVDKKADEFIAKFREQIRLQRIESIKRSARITRNSSRLS